MSIIFGIRKTLGSPATTDELQRMALSTQPFAPDGTFVGVAGRVGMGFQPFHTTRLSRRESQPAFDERNNALVFDGRLDNRPELLSLLDIPDAEVADSTLVLAGFERWGESVFSKLIGDWALALWCDRDQTMFLARDHAGTRPLYFQNTERKLLWSTYLETFFANGDRPLLDEEYIAAFLCSAPIGDLTPYQSIRAVPPAHYLLIQDGRIVKRRHWQCLPNTEIRYTSNTEYEEHFLFLFRQSVARRTTMGDPILAQLSGGMDSTSIVCMSDHIRGSQGYSSPDFLDTISYLSPSEPNWNEEPFIAATEKHRGKVGIHLEASYSERMFDPPPPEVGEHYFPGVTASTIEFQERLHASLGGRDYRVILSGIGGDEVLGGVPTPGPELANYVRKLDFQNLFKQSLAWSLASRTPMLHLLPNTIRFTAELYWPAIAPKQRLPEWVAPHLRKLCPRTDRSDLMIWTRLRSMPSALSNALAWSSLLETLPNTHPATRRRQEYRYPYLDRDLVDFLLRVPREQITRPSRRRLLMRRSLKDFVPIDVLERRRKAYVSRGPLIAFCGARARLAALMRNPMMSQCDYVDPVSLRTSLEGIFNGPTATQWPSILKAITFELWLRDELANRRAPETSLHRPKTSFEPHEQPSSGQMGSQVIQSEWILQ